MPTSAPGTCEGPAARRRRGFTLVETLVVVAVLGIAAAVGVVALTPDERGGLAREARRFAGALEYAAQRAQFRHETLGVSATGAGWAFWRRAADARWQRLDDDAALGAHALPPGVALVPLAYAGRALPADAVVPLRASGRNEPFAFGLRAASLEARVALDPVNRVTIDGPAAR